MKKLSLTADADFLKNLFESRRYVPAEFVSGWLAEEATTLDNPAKLIKQMKLQAERKFYPSQPDTPWTVFLENLITAAIESGADCGVVSKTA